MGALSRRGDQIVQWKGAGRATVRAWVRIPIMGAPAVTMRSSAEKTKPHYEIECWYCAMVLHAKSYLVKR